MASVVKKQHHHAGGSSWERAVSDTSAWYHQRLPPMNADASSGGPSLSVSGRQIQGYVTGRKEKTVFQLQNPSSGAGATSAGDLRLQVAGPVLVNGSHPCLFTKCTIASSQQRENEDPTDHGDTGTEEDKAGKPPSPAYHQIVDWFSKSGAFPGVVVDNTGGTVFRGIRFFCGGANPNVGCVHVRGGPCEFIDCDFHYVPPPALPNSGGGGSSSSCATADQRPSIIKVENDVLIRNCRILIDARVAYITSEPQESLELKKKDAAVSVLPFAAVYVPPGTTDASGEGIPKKTIEVHITDTKIIAKSNITAEQVAQKTGKNVTEKHVHFPSTTVQNGDKVLSHECHGIVLHGTCKAQISNVRIEKLPGCGMICGRGNGHNGGVVSSLGPSGAIKNCRVLSCHSHGIVAEGASGMWIAESYLLDNAGCGFLIAGRAHPTLRASHVAGNLGMSQVFAQDGSSGMVHRNTIGGSTELMRAQFERSVIDAREEKKIPLHPLTLEEMDDMNDTRNSSLTSDGNTGATANISTDHHHPSKEVLSICVVLTDVCDVALESNSVVLGTHPVMKKTHSSASVGLLVEGSCTAKVRKNDFRPEESALCETTDNEHGAENSPPTVHRVFGIVMGPWQEAKCSENDFEGDTLMSNSHVPTDDVDCFFENNIPDQGEQEEVVDKDSGMNVTHWRWQSPWRRMEIEEAGASAKRREEEEQAKVQQQKDKEESAAQKKEVESAKMGKDRLDGARGVKEREDDDQGVGSPRVEPLVPHQQHHPHPPKHLLHTKFQRNDPKAPEYDDGGDSDDVEEEEKGPISYSTRGRRLSDEERSRVRAAARAANSIQHRSKKDEVADKQLQEQKRKVAALEAEVSRLRSRLRSTSTTSHHQPSGRPGSSAASVRPQSARAKREEGQLTDSNNNRSRAQRPQSARGRTESAHHSEHRHRGRRENEEGGEGIQDDDTPGSYGEGEPIKFKRPVVLGNYVWDEDRVADFFANKATLQEVRRPLSSARSRSRGGAESVNPEEASARMHDDWLADKRRQAQRERENQEADRRARPKMDSRSLSQHVQRMHDASVRHKQETLQEMEQKRVDLDERAMDSPLRNRVMKQRLSVEELTAFATRMHDASNQHKQETLAKLQKKYVEDLDVRPKHKISRRDIETYCASLHLSHRNERKAKEASVVAGKDISVKDRIKGRYTLWERERVLLPRDVIETYSASLHASHKDYGLAAAAARVIGDDILVKVAEKAGGVPLSRPHQQPPQKPVPPPSQTSKKNLAPKRPSSARPISKRNK